MEKIRILNNDKSIDIYLEIESESNDIRVSKEKRGLKVDYSGTGKAFMTYVAGKRVIKPRVKCSLSDLSKLEDLLFETGSKYYEDDEGVTFECLITNKSLVNFVPFTDMDGKKKYKGNIDIVEV